MRLLIIILLLISTDCFADEVTSDEFNRIKQFAEAEMIGVFSPNKTKQAFAQLCLGNFYLNGEGTAKDPKEAVKWFRKSAELGNEMAKNNLGTAYIKGEGVLKDDKEAVKWFRDSAESGSNIGQSNLGICYASGTGVSKDLIEAYAYFNLSGITYESERENRVMLEKELTASQIEAGQKRSKELQREIEAKIAAKGEKK